MLAEDLGDDEDNEDGDYRQAEIAEVNRLPSFKKDASASKKRDSTSGEPRWVICYLGVWSSGQTLQRMQCMH